VEIAFELQSLLILKNYVGRLSYSDLLKILLDKLSRKAVKAFLITSPDVQRTFGWAEEEGWG